ncbi:MAG: M48 family metallopeptidase, partial [Gammaproteobacteria bacterium]|nr:M48 family metallopeptidase [Gammaproteobacteria bacterium]
MPSRREETRDVRLGSQDVRYTLVRAPGRRHVHIVFDEWKGLELRAPYRFSVAEADALIAKHRTWVVDTLAKETVRRPDLVDGLQLPLLDATLALRVSPTHIPRARRDADALIVPPGSN